MDRYKLYILPGAQKLGLQHQNCRTTLEKTFLDLSEIPLLRTVLGSNPWIYMTKIRGFSDFFEMLSTIKNRNFFSTEPIFKFFDFLKRYRSESLISAILDAQIKIRVPPDAHLCSIFRKNAIHSPNLVAKLEHRFHINSDQPRS